MSLKNILITYLVKTLSAITPSCKRKEGSAPHFLVVSTTALGDTLWSTPAIASIKSTYPQAILSVLTSKVGAEVLANNPHVDRIYVIKKPMILSLISLYFSLRKKAIDTIFIFHTSQRAIVPFCSLLKAKKMIGSSHMNKGLDSLLTEKVDPLYEHEIERRLRIVEKASIPPSQKTLSLHPTAEDYSWAIEWIQRHVKETNKILIGIHPGSKDLFKRWPPLCFVKLIDRLQKSYNCQIIITGSESEKELMESLSISSSDVILLSESVSIGQLGALIASFDLFITNDTGPMHIAFAMQTKTIALFTATDSLLCGPFQAKGAYVIQKHRTCTPCLRKRCLLPFCMLQIGVHEVEEAARSILQETTS